MPKQMPTHTVCEATPPSTPATPAEPSTWKLFSTNPVGCSIRPASGSFDDVYAAFDDEDDAYVAAVAKFGVGGGFVIARVATSTLEPVAVSAALFFTK